MTQRIEKAFNTIKGENRAALVTFIMGGDPDETGCRALLDGLPDAGADIIEIGMPFSDPMADGPTIQAAGLRALASGATLAKILAMVADFRTKHPATPIILMGYYNPVYHYGAEKFCRDAKQAGADGLILVDLPPEEEAELLPFIHAEKLSLIRLIAPTSMGERLGRIVASASGFVYYISVAGITGAGSATKASLEAAVKQLRAHTALPIALGFGIKTTEQAKEAAQLADAVVVGSALVERFHEQGAKAALSFVNSLAAAMKR
ncbi:MAG: tryptophan synthase subunit alpha [Alphaproteobacteria bacterium]|nr:tryptophan synthase subunit alpha [Alphaproteobacteria bacterium]